MTALHFPMQPALQVFLQHFEIPDGRVSSARTGRLGPGLSSLVLPCAVPSVVGAGWGREDDD
jgi:hypothetical protein